MGLSIYYKGRLKSKNMLTVLIEELTKIAGARHWVYNIFETEFKNSDPIAIGFNTGDFDDEIYGILLGPPNCEPLCFTFLSNGTMCSPFALEHYIETGDTRLMNGLFVKTHYAGPLVHKQVIHLLDSINSKYLMDFEISDDTDYWRHRDEKLLIGKFGEIDRRLNPVAGNLKTVKYSPGDDPTRIFYSHN